MLIDIANYLAALFREKGSRLSLRIKQALFATGLIVAAMLVVDIFALIVGPLFGFGTAGIARFGLVLQIPLTIALIAMVALIWGSADIAQEVIPQSAKNEIKTTRAIAIAAEFGGVNLLFLLIPIVFEVESTKAFYMLGVAAMAATMFMLPGKNSKYPAFGLAMLALLFFPFRPIYASTTTEGGVLDADSRSVSHTIGRKIADLKDIGLFYSPNKPAKQVVRNKTRDWAYDRAKEDASRTKPGNYNQLLEAVEIAGTHGYMAELAERKGFANAEGRRISLTSSTIVSGTQAEWVTIKNDGNPVEIFPGEIICVEGWMGSADFTDDRGHVLKVSPSGTKLRYDQLPDMHSQRYADFPMFAFLGRVNGDDSTVFVLREGCNAYQKAGTLEAVGNVPYFNINGLAAPNYTARKGRGQYSITRVGEWVVGS